jgi:cation transport regulator ChaB
MDAHASTELPPPLAADVVLPAQWFTPNHALPESERRLRTAILEDALRYYRDYADATDRRSRAFYADAADWIASRDRSEPFSFENVCDALGLDASAIRRTLRHERTSLRLVPRAGAQRHAA